MIIYSSRKNLNFKRLKKMNLTLRCLLCYIIACREFYGESYKMSKSYIKKKRFYEFMKEFENLQDFTNFIKIINLATGG